MIAIREAGKSYDRGKTWAVKNVSLGIHSGEWLVLLGSSGSGKSTLLKMINRLVDDFEGRIEVDGRDVIQTDPVALRRSIGYVFQGIGLFPHWTVEKNIAGIPALSDWTPEKRAHRAREMLKLMDLNPDLLGRRYPSELSGGQRQRVGVARALAADPAYLLMDEPFGSLDGVTRDALQQRILDLKGGLKKTVIFVTHDLFEAMTLGDRIAVMHEGKLEQVGSADQLSSHPATSFVRDLFQKPLEQLRRHTTFNRTGDPSS